MLTKPNIQCQQKELNFIKSNRQLFSPPRDESYQKLRENMNGNALFKINNNTFQLHLNSKAIKQRESTMHVNVPKSDIPKHSMYKASICVTNSRYSVIAKVAKMMGYKLVKETHLWNIFWADAVPGIEIYKEMKRFQKVNHFPGMQEICRKDLLARNLNRMLKLFPDDYDIFPRTWVFPADSGDAIMYNKENRSKTFILKPDQGAQGRGIWLTKNLKVVNPADRMICQIYINKPLLLDGYKFDLRVYTLITSVDPLRIFVYNEGLARFATSKYKEPSYCNTSNMYMHLTNYSVNKHSHSFCKDEEDGSKRKFSTINRRLCAEGIDVEALWRNIDDVIIKTVLSAWPMLKHNYHACFSNHDIMQACFEILGFDILIDRKYNPYVLEVNHSPSFHTDENIDKEVKEALVMDTLKLLNTSLVDKKRILNEDKKRVKTRLLKKRNGMGDSMLSNHKCGKSKLHPLSSLGQQIAWEETHCGGFRRVMPPPREANKYCKYFFLQNEASIYSNTLASMRRAEAAKQIRNSLLSKQKNNTPLGVNPPLKRLEPNIHKVFLSKERKVSERRRHDQLVFHEKWSPGFISDVEENMRLEKLYKRNKIVHQIGLLEMLYEAIYLNKNLSESDQHQYSDLYEFCRNKYHSV